MPATRPRPKPSERSSTVTSIPGRFRSSWRLPRRLDAEVEISESNLADLRRYIDAYDRGGGVKGPTKNLIFAANGPKPQIVLRDAMNNDIEIVEDAEHCLVYDRPIPAEGLRFSHLIRWWRDGRLPADRETEPSAGVASAARAVGQ